MHSKIQVLLFGTFSNFYFILFLELSIIFKKYFWSAIGWLREYGTHGYGGLSIVLVIMSPQAPFLVFDDLDSLGDSQLFYKFCLMFLFDVFLQFKLKL